MVATSNLTESDNPPKKYLSDSQLQNLLNLAKKNNYRDYALFYLSYKHGLRAIETTYLTFDNIDLNSNQLWVKRAKNSLATYHPLTQECHRIIKKLARNNPSNYLFPITTIAIRKICQKYNFHHHQLRHTCGINMARKGIDPLIIKNYLGHKNIQNTMIYINDAGINFQKLPDF